MIKFSQVYKRYPFGFTALQQIDFHLQKGEMAFLTGHSGAGKSTFLKLVAALETPSAGEIVVNQVKLSCLTPKAKAVFRSNLGITFQSPHLLYDRTVFENVAIPLHIQGILYPTVVKRVQTALDMVGLLPKEKILPRNLSTGEQQRVGIARAIVHKPALLIADEPTGNLDPVLSLDVMRLFEQFHQAGVSVLIATHDLALIANMKYRICMLKQGKLC